MTYKTYEVQVFDDGSKLWFLNGERHREDGPAIERANGSKDWYLNGKRHREEEFNLRTKTPLDGKIVILDGVSYRLVKE